MMRLEGSDLLNWQGFVSSEENSLGVLNNELGEEFQDRVGEVFSRKIAPRWSKEEGEIVKEAFRKYNAENPDKPAYSSPCIDHYNPSSVSIIAGYPEVALLGKSVKQIREKWMNELCPNAIGTVINKHHKQIINALNEAYPNNQWGKIAKVFAKTVLPSKPERMYYSNNTIKNYFKSFEKREKNQSDQPLNVDLNVRSITKVAKKVLAPNIKIKWSEEEEDAVKAAFEKYNAENPENPAYSGPCESKHKSFAFFAIAKYLKDAFSGWNRDSKQIREKWMNELCPNSLGSPIKEPSHIKIIEDLHQEHGNQWEMIVKLFARMDFEGKPEGKYYSSNTIKNYCLHNKKRTRDQYEAPRSITLKVPSIEERVLQNKVRKVFTRKPIKKWLPDEEDVIKEAVKKYNAENPKNLAYLGPCFDIYNCLAFSIIAEYPEVAALGRSPKQIREKWMNELCDNCIGSSIKEESHRQIIEKLYEVYGRRWGEIARVFAEFDEQDLPGKSKGTYYSGNTIKNHFNHLEKRTINRGEDSTDKDTVSPFDSIEEAMVESADLMDEVADHYEGAIFNDLQIDLPHTFYSASRNEKIEDLRYLLPV